MGAGFSHRVEEVVGYEDVRFVQTVQKLRALGADSNLWVGREVENYVHAINGLLDYSKVPPVPLYELKTLMFEPSLDVLQTASAQVVENLNFPARIYQSVDEV